MTSTTLGLELIPDTINDTLLCLQTVDKHNCPPRGSTPQLSETDARDPQPNNGLSLDSLVRKLEEGLRDPEGIGTPKEDHQSQLT